MATQGYSGYKGHDKIGADAIRGIQGVKGVAGTKGVRASIWHNNIEYEWDSDLNEYVHWVRKGNASIPMKLSEVKAKEKATAKAEGKNSPKHVKVPRAAFRRAMTNLAKDYQHAQKKFAKTGDKRYAETAERVKDVMLKSFALTNVAKEDKKEKKNVVPFTFLKYSGDPKDVEKFKKHIKGFTDKGLESIHADLEEKWKRFQKDHKRVGRAREQYKRFVEAILDEQDTRVTKKFPAFTYNGLTDSPEDLEKYKEHLKTLSDDELGLEWDKNTQAWCDSVVDYYKQMKGIPSDVYVDFDTNDAFNNWLDEHNNDKGIEALRDSAHKFTKLASQESAKRYTEKKWREEAFKSISPVMIGYDAVMTDDEIENYLEPIFSSPKTTPESLEPLKKMYTDKVIMAYADWRKQNDAAISDPEEYEFKKNIVAAAYTDARRRFVNVIKAQQLGLTELAKFSFSLHGFDTTVGGMHDYEKFLADKPNSFINKEYNEFLKSWRKELNDWEQNAKGYLSDQAIATIKKEFLEDNMNDALGEFIAIGDMVKEEREESVSDALSKIKVGGVKPIEDYKKYLKTVPDDEIQDEYKYLKTDFAAKQQAFETGDFFKNAHPNLHDDYRQIAQDKLDKERETYEVAVKAEIAWRKKNKPRVKQKVKPFMPDASFFPTDISEVQEVDETLGGSTGAKLVKDANGNNYIMKKGNSPEHVTNEFIADCFYQAAGVRVPACKLYFEEAGPVKLSQQLKNVTDLGKWWKSASETDRAEMQKKLRQGVAADVLLGNWDVVGLSADNILIDEEGTPWRIDNGGSMKFRAQGVIKNRASWGEMFDDLFTMTGNSDAIGLDVPSTIPQYFGTMRPLDIAREINSTDWSTALDTLNSEDRSVVEKRIEEARQLAERGEENEKYGRTEESTDELLAFSYQLCKDGLREALPKKIDLDENNFTTDWMNAVGWLCYGNTTETLNGKTYGSFTWYLKDKMGQEAIDKITEINKEQGGNSYNKNPLRRKLAILKSQGIDCTDSKYSNFEEFAQDAEKVGYYCALNQSKTSMQRMDFESVFNEARQNSVEFNNICSWVTQFSAALQLVFENTTGIPGVDRDNRTIFLCRTEDSNIIRDESGSQKPAKGERTYHNSGVCESHSHIKPVMVKGSELTTIQTPWSRVFGLWFIAPEEFENGAYQARDKGAFYKVNENEVPADTHGLPKVYIDEYDFLHPMSLNDAHKVHTGWEDQHPDEIV